MPWSGYWGGSWSGGGSPGYAFAIAQARAVGARAVRVTFTRAPLFDSPIGRYDAANLQRWELVRQDTGKAVPLLGVRPSSDGNALAVELLMSDPFASSPLVVYELTANQIKSATGLMIVDPLTVEFFGMPGIREVIERPRPLLDLFNPQVDRDTLRGALQVGTDGDYVLQEGPSLIRKLIVRRLTTALDEYYHLTGKAYGAGVMPKGLLRAADLVTLQRQLENECVKEAEVLSASVSLTLHSSGRLDIRASLTLRANQQLTVQFPFNPQAGFNG
jgi:hypothetical protein